MIGNIAAGLYGVGVAPSTNSYESIATVTVGGGGSSTITFSSIPSTYKHLQIRAMSRDTYGANYINLAIRFNGDSGNTTTFHQLYGEGSNPPSAGGGTAQTFGFIGQDSSANATANSFGVTVGDVFDYVSTSKYKTFKGISGVDNNGNGIVGLFSGVWLNTNAITSITLLPNVGSFTQYSHFALYGIKD